MLVSPDSRLEEHLRMLRWISRIARDADFVSFIRQARTTQEILDVLHERAG
jgi:mannitol/fructose-specific phosphotransferase system IIA component (Ntr-type)